jgi:diadenosine tetraphosphatase ApaH/serine/threonine PP2A family protein phosphatase
LADVRRTIIIGDVQGCLPELDDLVERVGLTSGDALLFVGDLVARGPDSLGVLRRVRELGGRSVIGNHEERLLAARSAKRRAEAPPKLEASHEELLAKLEDEDWAQLESLPLRITLDEHGIWIVHGGIVPGIPFEKQDPWMVTHIRSISEHGEPSSKRGPLWAERWHGPEHVVFGHNARRKPQLHAHATGIDTACVYGEHLTALVLPEGSAVPPPDVRPDALVAVRARKAYADYPNLE